MPKKIVVVNADPRKGWNTDTLLMEAARYLNSGNNCTFKSFIFGNIFAFKHVVLVSPPLRKNLQEMNMMIIFLLIL